MEEKWLKQAKFLIVDDQEFNISLLERILRRRGYNNTISSTDPLELESLYEKEQPDIILLDLHMPNMDGYSALQLLRTKISPQDYVPILVLTADVTVEAKQRALNEGAFDFLTKPFDTTEVVLRIQNLLRTRYLHLQLQAYNHLLEQRVQQRTAELRLAQLETLELLGRTTEYRDDVTGGHTQRVGDLSADIASGLGLPEDEVERIRLAAPLHDIGKIGIPDEVLLKPGRFTEEEFELMRTHTSIGASILEGSHFPVLELARTIALSHHERWDGTGYPHGLSGTSIPLAGRIVAVADVFDALMHQRPYKRAWTLEETIAEIERLSGSHFDPDVVAAFVSLTKRGRNNL